jgi:hypothetical protein
MKWSIKMKFDDFCREMFSYIPSISGPSTAVAMHAPAISAHRDDEGMLAIYRYQTPIGWIAYDKSHRCYKAVTVGGEVCNFNTEEAALGFVHEQYA